MSNSGLHSDLFRSLQERPKFNFVLMCFTESIRDSFYVKMNHCKDHRKKNTGFVHYCLFDTSSNGFTGTPVQAQGRKRN